MYKGVGGTLSEPQSKGLCIALPVCSQGQHRSPCLSLERVPARTDTRAAQVCKGWSAHTPARASKALLVLLKKFSR